jgi:hypothetical protein
MAQKPQMINFTCESITMYALPTAQSMARIGDVGAKVATSAIMVKHWRSRETERMQRQTQNEVCPCVPLREKQSKQRARDVFRLAEISQGVCGCHNSTKS